MLPRNDPDRIQVAFDDHRLVANAGLILPVTLAHRLGLGELVDQHVDLGDAPGRTNAGDKMLTLVASALAGGDVLMARLRQGRANPPQADSGHRSLSAGDGEPSAPRRGHRTNSPCGPAAASTPTLSSSPVALSSAGSSPPPAPNLPCSPPGKTTPGQSSRGSCCRLTCKSGPNRPLVPSTSLPSGRSLLAGRQHPGQDSIVSFPRRPSTVRPAQLHSLRRIRGKPSLRRSFEPWYCRREAMPG